MHCFDDVEKKSLDCHHQKERMWMYEYMNFDDTKEESNKTASKNKHLF